MYTLGLDNILSWALSSGIKVALILLVAFVATKFARVFIVKFLRRIVKQSLKFANSNKELDEERQQTIGRVLISIIRLVIWLIAILTILPELGINIAPLLAGLGVVGLALSFGARGLIQDYISGLFMLLEDHYQIGEQVELAGTTGKVKDFNLRRTVIKDEAGDIHYIPNSQIKKASNFSRK